MKGSSSGKHECALQISWLPSYSDIFFVQKLYDCGKRQTTEVTKNSTKLSSEDHEYLY